MSGPYALCSAHSDALASFECEGCGRLLCYECVDEGRLTVCRHCGERAFLLEEIETPDRDGDAPPASDGEAKSFAAGPPATGAPDRAEPAGGTLYTPARDPVAAESAPFLAEQPAAIFVHHVVVPVAMIAMVAALLFFLLDLRSVFFGGSPALKWVGFCFVTATVLIARYGEMTYGAERQGCYTLALAAATITVMVVSPWESPQAGLAGPLVNAAIVLAVWRFATATTRGLSLEGEDWRPLGRRLYGLERLAFEEWQRQRDDVAPVSAAARAKPEETRRRGNPSAAVARLVVVALVVFALGEPIVLAGPPAVGERGLAAMIVFLFSTGAVLAAASAVAAYRRARRHGARTSVGAVPGRVAIGALLMVAILAVALAVPGVEYRGTGSLRRAALEDGAQEGEAESGERGEEGEAGEAEDSPEPPPSESSAKRTASPAAALLEFLSGLGRLLRIPFLLALAALAGFALWRLGPRLATLWRGALKDRWRHLLDRLAALFRGLGRRPRSTAAPRGDPLVDLGSLSALPPREAVLAAYGRLLAFFDRLGHPRPERQTPNEFQSYLARNFKHLAEPAGRLTAAYVKAAYSEEEVDSADRRDAIAALEELRLSTG